MGYDEQYFAKSANKKAMTIWLTLGIVLSVAYLIEIFKGLRTIEYYLTFLAFCWIPFFYWAYCSEGERMACISI